MRLIAFLIVICLFVPLGASAQQKPRQILTWVDDEGVRHYGDSIPPEYAEKPKEVLNDQGVTIAELEGKKTEEQLRAEEAARKLEEQRLLQARADQSLLLTYQSVEEILMHRDRRVELFQAQARVTELYLRNLNRRLGQLKNEASRYKPYSADPDAPMVDPGLVEEIAETDGAIARHEGNLEAFRQEEREIINRFNASIRRFKQLKGIEDEGVAGEPQSRLADESVAQAVPE